MVRKWAVALATEMTWRRCPAVRHHLHARLVSPDGRKHRQGSRNFDEYRRALRHVDIGDKCFIADEVVLGDEGHPPRLDASGQVKTPFRRRLRRQRRRRAAGRSIPDGALIGVKSKPPANDQLSPNETWFGSPPSSCPNRQKMDAGGDMDLFAAVVEGLDARHVRGGPTSRCRRCSSSPSAHGPSILRLHLLRSEYARRFGYFAVFGCVMISLGCDFRRHRHQMGDDGTLRATGEADVVVLGHANRSGRRFCTGGLAGRVFLDHLRGTPFLPWMLRLFGSKFGKGVFMDSTDITEFDCVKVGDYVPST